MDGIVNIVKILVKFKKKLFSICTKNFSLTKQKFNIELSYYFVKLDF